MFSLSRSLLIASVLVFGYVGLVLICLLPGELVFWTVMGLGVVMAAVKGKRTLRGFTAHGSAFWAKEADVRRAGMLGASRGLIVGELLEK